MQTSDFEFDVPPELIAQVPATQRDQSRLLVLNRSTGRIRHGQFLDLLEYVQPGDLLVLNNSKVLRARLWATKDSGSSEFEMLLLEEQGPNLWWALLRPGKRIRMGSELTLHNAAKEKTRIHVKVVRKTRDGQYLVAFSGGGDIKEQLDRIGEIPLPPYIKRQPHQIPPLNDFERYQTVYAERSGSVAAPTAGLHFTDELLSRIRGHGVDICCVTLHAGLGTFAPVKTESVESHVMHEECFELSSGTADAIQKTRKMGGRIIAVGTTTVRVLETVAAANDGAVCAAAGRTRIFIYPPYQFRITDALLTNFHLPCSTLLMLVSAFAAPGETRGRETLLSAYAEAIHARYRLFSYGDAMLLL